MEVVKVHIIIQLQELGQLIQEVVEVVVDAGEGTKAKDVWAVFRPDHVKVVVNGETKFEVGGDKPPGLFRKVRPDDCTWTIESGKVVVTLQKTDEQLWHDLIAVP